VAPVIHHACVTSELQNLFTAQGRVATSPQILKHVSRRRLQRHLKTGHLVKIWPNIYCLGEPNDAARLCGLDLLCGEPVVVCLGTAAKMLGFDTQGVTALHVLNPIGHLLRDRTGLVVHRRKGAPLATMDGRALTAPAWTAVEVARSLQRPRALATLDAALRSQACTVSGLNQAAVQQAGRRGIVGVRQLIPLARPDAESPMESEARLAMLDGGLPEPVLQHRIIDRDGILWRVDFAWPDRMVAVEYDGYDWHSSPDALRQDRQKRAALEEIGWRVMSIVSDDVRRRSTAMARRIDAQLRRRVRRERAAWYGLGA
jgi:very-short-patch-repair endonuclease